MTMDLRGPQGEEHFNNTSWQQLLELAIRYGWKPAGVVEVDHSDDYEDEEALEDEDAFDEEEEEDEGDGEYEEGEEEEEEGEEEEETAEEEGGLSPQGEAAEALGAALRSMFPSDPVLARYFYNDGNRVADEDAAALAAALESALPDIPEHDALGHKSFEHPAEPGVRLIRFGTPVNPFEWFSGENKKRVQEFIAFCRQGGFEIW